MKIRNALSVAALCFAGAVSSSAQAEQFSGNGQAACLSEELLDQLIMAAVQEDTRGFNYLLKNGCIIPRAGVEVSVLDRSWTTVHVRAYAGDVAVELWTVPEALKD